MTRTAYGPENTDSRYSGNGMGQHYTDARALIVRNTIELASHIGAKRVLDLACGRGITSLALAEEVPSIQDIFAVDINTEAVHELWLKSAQMGSKNHAFNRIHPSVYSAADQLGFYDIADNQRCDLVVAKDLYPFLNPEDADQMLGNVEEILTPKGWFVITAASTRSRLFAESTPGPEEESPLYRAIDDAAQAHIQTTLPNFNFTNIADLSGQLHDHRMEMVEAEHIGRAGGWILAVAQKLA